MTQLLKWDQTAEHFYETGISNCALYVQESDGTYPKGAAWNGITAITESPSGGEANPVYADNIKYLNLYSAEDFGATIEALYYPVEFGACNGDEELVEGSGVYVSQQERKTFGLCYKTIIGNDVDNNDHGYKLHIIYGAKASPSEQAFNTVNDSPEPSTFSWEITTIPVDVNFGGLKPTAHLVIDSRKVNPEKLAALEAILYGTAAVTAKAAVYKATEDTTYNSAKTYYTRSGSGTDQSPYSYTEAEIDAFADATTYYELVSAAVSAADAVDARLPLPAEIATVLQGN